MNIKNKPRGITSGSLFFEAVQSARREEIVKGLKELEYQPVHESATAAIVHDTIANRSKLAKRHQDFSNAVRNGLIFEALNVLFEASSTYPMQGDNHRVIKNKVISNFIEQTGSDKILATLSRTNAFTAQIAKYVTETHKAIMEDNEEALKSNDINDEPKVSPDDTETFIDKVNSAENKEEIQDIGDSVKNHVANGIEQFIIANIEDKEHIKDVLQNVEDKVATIQAANAEEEQEIKESAIARGRLQIKKRLDTRKVGLYEAMVRDLSKKALTNPSYGMIKESGTLDMDKITAACEATLTMMVLSEALGFYIPKDIQKQYDYR
jgi:hypothetical protein